MAPDYLTDGRLMKVTFMQLKKHLESSGVPKNDLFAASTKFALVAVAEKHDIKLDKVLDSIGPYEAPTEGGSPPAKKKAAENGSPDKEAKAIEKDEEAMKCHKPAFENNKMQKNDKR